MNITWSAKIDEILKVGKPLHDIGISNWALTKDQTFKVLEQFLSSKISILGGDVYEKTGDSIRSNYDNWYCDQLPQETKEDFLYRSIKRAVNYIELYNINLSENIFFALVPET